MSLVRKHITPPSVGGQPGRFSVTKPIARVILPFGHFALQ